jgi:hypothetical protein
MKKFSLTLFVLIASLFVINPFLVADGFDDLAGLADGGPVEELSEEPTEGDLEDMGLDLSEEAGEYEEEAEGESSISLTFGGYLKTLAYWSEESYAEKLWGHYQELAMYNQPAPDKQKLSGYNNVGSRLQLKIEGFLGDSARLFSAFNISYNLARSLHAEYNKIPEKSSTEIRPVESYIELYEDSRTWKIGSQIVTWGYMEGVEVPTDRVNARDQSYKSTEYEDSKLASTGILMTQLVGDAQFEILAIPVSKQNISSEFTEYLFTAEDEAIEQKPNNGKWATRFSGTVGNLDAAVSYVEGLDTALDLNETGDGKAYHRIKSPGLDLQYNFGSLLGKVSYAAYLTEDEDGDEIMIKNPWSKVAAGTEFSIGGSTINIYAGQVVIENFQDDEASKQKGFLMGQIAERTDFLSGHMNANFLTGNALNLVLMAAGYWDEKGTPMRSFYKATLKYKISDGLDLLFSPSYSDYQENKFTDVQAEVKYSF